VSSDTGWVGVLRFGKGGWRFMWEGRMVVAAGAGAGADVVGDQTQGVVVCWACCEGTSRG
jgi:hypothetical protein